MAVPPSSVASLTLSRASSSSLVLSIQDGIFANAHYHGTPRFLLGMQVLLFLSRPLVIKVPRTRFMPVKSTSDLLLLQVPLRQEL